MKQRTGGLRFWAALGLLSLSVGANAALKLPAAGCPMSHCDPEMSCLVNLKVPAQDTGPVIEIWRRDDDDLNQTKGESTGTNGLGCASDGTRAFCTYQAKGAPPADLGNLTAYLYDETLDWDSDDLLNEKARAGTPLIMHDDSGNPLLHRVVGVDNNNLVIFNYDTGAPELPTPTPLSGGIPLAPVPIIDASGNISGIVVATSVEATGVLGIYTSPVYLFDEEGTLRQTFHLTSADVPTLLQEECEGGPPQVGVTDFRWDTINVPAISEGRIFLTMRCVRGGMGHPDDLSILVRLDVDNLASPASLTKRWEVKFYGPNKASPLLMDDVQAGGRDVTRVFFDGRVAMDAPNSIMAVDVDSLTQGTIVWNASIPGAGLVRASFARHPNTTEFWFNDVTGFLYRWDQDGPLATEKKIHIMTVLNFEPDQFPGVDRRTGVMSIVEPRTGTEPVMIISPNGNADDVTSAIAAVDLDDAIVNDEDRLLWKVLNGDEAVLTQFPLMEDSATGNTRVLYVPSKFSGSANPNGAVCLGGDLPPP